VYTLITAATSSQAYKLKNSLHIDPILLGDHLELPDILIRSGNVIRLPDPASPSYTHQMLSLCLDKNITVIYPLRQDEAKLLTDAQQLFSEYGISIIQINEIH
jgi:hypothetical protein